jgi:hypothetical protein
MEEDLTLAEVAVRLHKSARWLRDELKNDRDRARRERAEPRLQHHHHIGRTPLWTEGEFLALKAALIAQEKRRREARESEQSGHPGSPSSSVTVSGMSPARYAFEDPQRSCDAVLSYRPGQNSKTTRSKANGKSKPISATRSSTGSSHRSRLGLRLVDTSD